MEEHLNPLVVTHLLQYTLRSLCSQDNSQWIYAVFWRILPRNYPPPKWDTHGGVYDRSRGNRRNWILVWEDGYCNFGGSSTAVINSSGSEFASSSTCSSTSYGDHQFQPFPSLQPELFFKMSHEIYNYGEGLIGKVAADNSHKWIYKEADENQEINFLSAWHNSADAQPRTWEAQFQSGIKTIALIAVREGVVQLGSMNKVMEDLNYVVLLRKKLAYIESIPGVLLPHPSSSPFPTHLRPIDGYGLSADIWDYQSNLGPIELGLTNQAMGQFEYYNQAHYNQQPHMVKMITPSMSSLEALLSKLPSVGPGLSKECPIGQFLGPTSAQKGAKEELDEEEYHHQNRVRNNGVNNHEREIVGECSSTSMSSYQQYSYHQHDFNLIARTSSPSF